VARADRRRSQRAGTHARGSVAAARAPRARVARDDELFFSRIRRQGKWIFAIIAILFILSTILLGVGTGFGGLQDFLVSQGSTGGVSADDARAAIRENPNDAQAHRDLSSALQADGKLEEAIPPLARYVRLTPNDTDARRELAGLYLRQADFWRRRAQVAQIQIQNEAPGQTFQPPGDSKLGQALPQDQLTAAKTARLNAELNEALTKMQSGYQNAVGVYKQLAKAEPQDATVQFELAQAAEAASDLQTAIAAYKQFLKLAPEDQSAAAVRERIKQLEGAVASTEGG
jgi:tetratricopeptide (TPR) repeat protein